MNSAQPTDATLDVGQLLDRGPFTYYQQFIVVMAALTVIVDGFDSQLIGFAIPVISKEWGIARSAFAPVVAAGLLGMGIGSACAGLLGDRFGRRFALLTSVLMFGVATCSIAFAPSLFAIGVLRFFAGLGIGGALPTSTTISAEFSPLRSRTLAVTATMVCVPLGGMFAGLFAGNVLPQYGWRVLFGVGGAMPLAFALVLAFALPESPRFLARREERWPELARLLSRFSAQATEARRYTDSAEQRLEQHKGFSALLRPEYRRDTIALWFGFFMCMLAIYSAFSWLPTMLTSAGLGVAVASTGLTAYNMGGVLGALLCAVAIARFGSRWPMLLCSFASAISAVVLVRLPMHQHTTALIVGLGVHGLFVNAVQSTMYALCAHVYKTVVRATGTATAAAFGRLGAVASSFAGAAAMAAGGSAGYLTMLGIAMMLVFVAVASVRGHILPS